MNCSQTNAKGKGKKGDMVTKDPNKGKNAKKGDKAVKGGKKNTVCGSKLSQANLLKERRQNRLIGRLYRFCSRWGVSGTMIIGMPLTTNVTVAGCGFLLGKLNTRHPSQIIFSPPKTSGSMVPSIQVLENVILSESVKIEDIIETEPEVQEELSMEDGGHLVTTEDSSWNSKHLECFLEEKMDWRRIEVYKDSLARLRRHVRGAKKLDHPDYENVQILIDKLLNEDQRGLYSLFLDTLHEILGICPAICDPDKIIQKMIGLVESDDINKPVRQRIRCILESVKKLFPPQTIVDSLMSMVLNCELLHVKISILAFLRAVVKLPGSIEIKTQESLIEIVTWMEDAALERHSKDTIWTLANKDRNLINLPEPYQTRAYKSVGIPAPLGVSSVQSGDVTLQSSSRGESSNIVGLPQKKSKLSTKKKPVVLSRTMPPPSSIKHTTFTTPILKTTQTTPQQTSSKTKQKFSKNMSSKNML